MQDNRNDPAQPRSHPLDQEPSELLGLAAAVLSRVATALDASCSPSAAPCTLVAHPEIDGGAAYRSAVARALELRKPGAVVGSEQGRPLDDVLGVLLSARDHGPFGPHPCTFSHFHGGGLPEAAIGGAAAQMLNVYAGVWWLGPVATEMEAAVVRWCSGDVVGYDPAASGGFLTSCGSEATLCAVVAARCRAFPESRGLERAVVYVGDQTHFSAAKGAGVAGIPLCNVRTVQRASRVLGGPLDLRLDVEALRAEVEKDRNNGLTPFMVVATAGTTATGTVDDLGAVARAAAELGLWMHVDAAYGGFYALTGRGRSAMAGIALADSVSMDFHKGLFLPCATSALVVRRQSDLRAAFCAHPGTAAGTGKAYLDGGLAAREQTSFCDVSPELTRPFRAGNVWLPLAHRGVAAFRACLDEKLDLADALAKRLDASGVAQVVTRSLSIVTFRPTLPEGAPDDVVNEATQAMVLRILEGGSVNISAATVRGMRLGRAAIVNFRTHAEHVELLASEIIAAARHVLGQ
eukprot:m51a1_g10422 putative aromatic-L-amino-acid decarboxylase (520) ;mRNA; r:6755-8432